jgi:hypothetical protein
MKIFAHFYIHQQEQYFSRILKKILPTDIELEVCDCTVSILKYDDSNRKMLFDMWIPKFNLALEYQVRAI